jgi:outer membrane receptor protein involved in Fe transport
MRRDFTADRFLDDSNPEEIITLPRRTLHDWGLYTQLLYGFRYGWAAGVRYEFAGGSGASIGGRKDDPFRADRHRVSPLLLWQPSEFTRIRLQYNFDHADHLDGDEIANAVWLGFEWLYGAHPAHEY